MCLINALGSRRYSPLVHLQLHELLTLQHKDLHLQACMSHQLVIEHQNGLADTCPSSVRQRHSLHQQEALGASERVISYLDAPEAPQIASGKPLPEFSGQVRTCPS